MTALDHYSKLEAEAVYFDGADDPGREVILNFGARSLIIMTVDERVLGHWPLAGLRATAAAEASESVNLAPSGVGDERVLLNDAEMLAAIEAVCPTLHSAPSSGPTRRRSILRPVVMMLLLALVGATAWGMMRAPDFARSLLTEQQTADLGRALSNEIAVTLGGDGRGRARRCTTGDGDVALSRLRDRLWSSGAPAVVVVPGSAVRMVAVPGFGLILTEALIDDAATPEELAAWIALGAAYLSSDEPLRAIADAGGVEFLVGILAGDLTDRDRVVASAAALMGQVHTPDAQTAAEAAAARRLTEAGLPTSALASARARLAGAAALSNPQSHGLAPSDGAVGAVDTPPFRPALNDRDWLALKVICDHSVVWRRR